MPKDKGWAIEVGKRAEKVMATWPQWKRDAVEAAMRIEPCEKPDGDYSWWPPVPKDWDKDKK